MSNSTTKYSEAREDARRLTKVTGREVEAVSVVCPCDYSPACYRCAGSGSFYEPRYASCGHTVQDGDDFECDANDCARKEREASMVERVDTFPAVGVPIKSCRDRAIEEIEREVA